MSEMPEKVFSNSAPHRRVPYCGLVKSDISLRTDTASNNYFYKGKLSTVAFDLGKFYSSTALGPITSDLSIEGSGLSIDKMDVAFDGRIDAFYANHYNYTGIDAKGTFRKKFFDGKVRLNDPNALVDFEGQIDFTQPDPLLDFKSTMHHVDLKALHLLTDFPYSSVSAEMRVKSKGLDFEKFVGQLHFNDITYCSLSHEYYIDHFDITASRLNGLQLDLNSDVAVGSLHGDVQLNELAASFQEILSEVIPSFDPPEHIHRTQQFDVQLEILDFY